MSVICSNELFYFKKGLIRKGKWKLGGFDLVSDGTIYSDCKKPVNLLKSIPFVMCGVQTRTAPDRPKLESWMNENLLVCVAYKEGKQKLWLLFPNVYHLWSWLYNLGEVVKMSCWHRGISQLCTTYLEIQTKINKEIRKNKKIFTNSKNNANYNYYNNYY